MKSDDKNVVREWEIPFPPELGDKPTKIGIQHDGDTYIMNFTGSKMDLCILASQLLRAAGVKKLEVDKVK